MGKRIPTQHPDPAKQGTNIAKEKYNVIRLDLKTRGLIHLANRLQDAQP